MGCGCCKGKKDDKGKPYGPKKDDKGKKGPPPKPGPKPGEKPGLKPGQKPGPKPGEKKPEVKPVIPPDAQDIVLTPGVYSKPGIKDGYAQTELTNPKAIHMCTCDCIDDLEYRYDIEEVGFMELCKARLVLHPPKRGCTVLSINSDPPIAGIIATVLLVLIYYLPLPMAILYSVALFGVFYAI